MENKDDKKIAYKTSLICDDSLYEMTYDEKTQTTQFVKTSSSGEVEVCKEIDIGSDKFIPLPPKNMLLQKRVLLFPSEVQAYETEEKLLIDVQNFIHKYVEVSDDFESIASYYVLFTWMYDRFNEVPYLRAIGDFGSGKSRFLQTVGSICYKPIFTTGATTTSPIFRILDDAKGTLILDEADFKFSDQTADIVKVLNSGYQKGYPLLRSEGVKTYEVKAFEVFGPKIVATREMFSDQALESRFFVEHMGISKLRKDIPRTLESDFYKEGLTLRNKLLMWRLKNYFKPLKKIEEVIENIHPRLNQIAMPLLSVIKDDSISERLKKFIIEYNNELVADRGRSREADIILAILKLKKENNTSKLRIKAISDELALTTSEEDFMSSKKVGWYLHARLQLKSKRTRDGYVISLEDNMKKILFWKERFGIIDEDICGEDEHIDNDVNVVTVPPSLDIEEVRPSLPKF